MLEKRALKEPDGRESEPLKDGIDKRGAEGPDVWITRHYEKRLI